MENERIIDSTQNPRIKAAVKLRKARFRNESRQTLVEGFREIQRAVESGWRFKELYHCPELYLQGTEEHLVETLLQMEMPVFRCSQSAFRKMSYRDTPDGLIALSPLIGKTLEDIQLGEKPLVLVAEHIEKPGNLGTILRTADATGVDAVIVCDPNTDLNNPNVIRASIGSLFFLPVAKSSMDATFAWLNENHIQTIAAVPGAHAIYTDMDMRGGTAIIVGAEDTGLSASTIEAATHRTGIPMLGRNDSLNVSTATAVLLYEALRQRRENP